MKTIWTSAIAISLTGAITHSTEAINLYNGSGLPADNSPQSLVPAAICASNSPQLAALGALFPLIFRPIGEYSQWGRSQGLGIFVTVAK